MFFQIQKKKKKIKIFQKIKNKKSQSRFQPKISDWIRLKTSDDNAAGYLLRSFDDMSQAAYETHSGLLNFKELIESCKAKDWKGAFALQNRLIDFLNIEMRKQAVCIFFFFTFIININFK